MSETVVDTPLDGGNQVTLEDLQKMLEDRDSRLKEVEGERDRERNLRTSIEIERDNERAARYQTEQERDGHAARAVTEAERRWTAERDAVARSKEAQQAALQDAEEDYARLAETGEWKAAAAAQRRMAEAAAKLNTYGLQEQHLERNKPGPPQAPAPRAEPPRPQPHRYSQHVGDLMPGEAEWLDRRPQFATDQSYRNQVIGASQFAVGRGFQRGTPQYFAEMERVLGEAQPANGRDQHDDQVDDEPPPRRAAPRRQPSADVPAPRRAAPGADPVGARRGEVTLTADERVAANDLFGNIHDRASYIADEAERYRYYDEMKRKRAARFTES